MNDSTNDRAARQIAIKQALNRKRQHILRQRQNRLKLLRLVQEYVAQRPTQTVRIVKHWIDQTNR